MPPLIMLGLGCARKALFQRSLLSSRTSARLYSAWSNPKPSLSFAHAPRKYLSSSTVSSNDTALSQNPSPTSPEPVLTEQFSYHGPLAATFRRLKIFSLSSLGLSFTMAPFIFIVESSLPSTARVFLAAVAISTSTISTALVGWCGAPYVTTLRRLIPAENGGIPGVEMTTMSLTLKKLVTRVYDSDFLFDSKRPFAQWELAQSVKILPAEKDAVKIGNPGDVETVAETVNVKGEVIGRWIVKWGEGGEGTCEGTGKIVRHFNVHKELLN
ncbi:hypothetical protein BJ138DRAFT_1127744 [Hygrophoropsis aurantiaca]|uniref:Uncharacterized protein n=1 Tax=Hygrophoropsis aurantiaca TaxID=72124 RepID=A0ACB8A9H0_9AGAM|nr:hypothetical protein BJ138DRAFT_1127744 [Hygrophoropsis aurantiaca]